jgi:RNA polymerase sigma factor (sigma-70 family)
MDFEALIRDEQDGLTRRLAYMLGGDLTSAEDLRQEALLRAWRSMPRGAERVGQRAWLHRTAANLAVDELRRRARRPAVALEDADELVATAQEPDAAREALARLPVHERFVLLLRFDAGFAYGEIARLLEVSQEAARKRVARARAAFIDAYRIARADLQPLIVLVSRGEAPEPYTEWLERAGARVSRHAARPSERDLALADGLVFTGAFDDVHSRLYGERPRALRGSTDLAQDRGDLAVLVAVLALGLPFVGVCRGHQLLNIACGGSLYQDVVLDGATRNSHDTGQHRVQTNSGTAIRRLVGREVDVHSEHHQAVRRLGHKLAVAAGSPDGLIETVEHLDQRFLLGLQWHPETDPGGAGDRVAEALVDAALRRAA